MAKKVLILGLGMQGKAILYDLANCGEISQITVADSRPDLQHDLAECASGKVSGRQLDAADKAGLAGLMGGVDLVVEALPGPLALSTGRLAADAGVSLVSSMYYYNPAEQDPAKKQAIREQMQEIDRQAKRKGIVILTEFGLDPGLDQLMGVRAISEMDEVREFHAYGAGIPGPNARSNPLQYKFSWSVMGVMRAYRRPATVITGGKVVQTDGSRVFEAANRHILEVEELGAPLECYPNGDAVHHAEMYGIRDSVKEMGQYTCRLPGHCAFWDAMVKSGFLRQEAVRVGGADVVPIEFTASLLSSQEQFHYADDEEDMTFIRVDVHGIRKGRNRRVIYQLIDRRDFKTGFTSMQRTVGFTMGQGARLILEGKLGKPGLLTPLDVPYEDVMPALEKHGIRVSRQEVLLE